ncbi:MAG: HpcH/HpaI aldolase/citrate lyase family protein [Lachnospiraceae bacterium]|jgi:Citrate lyase beta subunit
MKDLPIYYSTGALLYCPANNKSVASSVINNKFGKKYSLALCLEDTINDKYVQEAENILYTSLLEIYQAQENYTFFLPYIFIRIRNTGQIFRLEKKFKEINKIITGYIIPKFSIENANSYIQAAIKLNENSVNPVYIMPIYESPSIIDLRTRYDILYTLKDKISKIEDRILNIRVGGNDLCHIFGFRRRDNESIHQIKPVAQVFSDICTVYGMDYVVSGPVWEYFNSNNWIQGLQNEINDDKLCGFTGKTVIHPKQIEIINNAYKVNKDDYFSAKSILNWDTSSHSFVSPDINKQRMDEYKTHTNWAKKILLMSEVFGIK